MICTVSFPLQVRELKRGSEGESLGRHGLEGENRMLRRVIKDMERQMESTVEAATIAVKTLEGVVEAEERGRRGQAPRGVSMIGGARLVNNHASERVSGGGDEARTMVKKLPSLPPSFAVACSPSLHHFPSLHHLLLLRRTCQRSAQPTQASQTS